MLFPLQKTRELYFERAHVLCAMGLVLGTCGFRLFQLLFFFFFFCILSVLCIFPPSPICYSFSLSPPTMQILFTLSILCVIYPPKELEGVRAVWPERCKTFDMTWLSRIVSGIKLVELVNEKLPVLLQFSQNAVFEHWFQQLWWWKCWQDTAEYSK